MVITSRSAFAALAMVLCTATAPAFGQAVRIQSEGAVDTRIPIAVPPFAADPTAREYSDQLSRVLGDDLAFTGLFTIVPPAQYPAGFSGFPADATKVDFEAWRATPAEHLVYAYVTVQGDALVAECRLFDVLVSQQVVGKRLAAQRGAWRLLAHHFADEVVRFLTGVAGIASSEITFSAGEPGDKEIYVADYDGGGIRQVTEHHSISIMPKFSPDGRKIAYLSYKDRYPFLYIYDRDTGVSSPLSKRVGLNHAPAWSPDGTNIAMCLSKDGNTEIYLKRPDGSDERRLTNDRASDTSPVFSPDGTRIAFVSDRAGRPQIFVMSATGANPQRLSFQGGSSYDPNWSPDGRFIAYVVEKPGDGLEIYVMNADGSNPQRLSNSRGSNESPSWSADSRHIVFTSTRDGVPRLYTVTLETGEERAVPGLLQLRAEGPSWGPRRN